jgi:hypothetical protein
MKRLLLAVVFGTVVAPLVPAAHEPADADVAGGATIATHPLVRASLDRLWDGSPSWRASLQGLPRDRTVVVLTPDEVRVQDGRRTRPFEADLLGEVTPVAENDGRIRQVVVVVNVPLIESTHARRLSTLSELYADLDRVVAHEVFGHAIPYLVAGDVSGRCADPAAGERPEDSCAIRRENLIRAELGLGRRTDAGLFGLALARRSRY